MVISTLLQHTLISSLHEDLSGEREVRGKETVLLFPPVASLIAAHTPQSPRRGVALRVPLPLLKQSWIQSDISYNIIFVLVHFSQESSTRISALPCFQKPVMRKAKAPYSPLLLPALCRQPSGEYVIFPPLHCQCP